jgi:hypothetical protein
MERGLQMQTSFHFGNSENGGVDPGLYDDNFANSEGPRMH